jgi:hypothetical protein
MVEKIKVPSISHVINALVIVLITITCSALLAWAGTELISRDSALAAIIGVVCLLSTIATLVTGLALLWTFVGKEL